MNRPANDGDRKVDPEEVIGRILDEAARKGLEEAEVFLLDKRSLSIAAKKGRVDQLQRHDELAAALRIVKDERLGFAYTAVFSPEAIARTVEEAAAGAAFSDARPGLGLPRPPAGPYPEVEGPDPQLDDIPLEAKIDRALEMEAAALSSDPRVEKVRRAQYREVAYTVRLANRFGLDYRHSGAVFLGGISIKAQENDSAEMGYESDFSNRYNQLDLAAIGRKGAARALDALGGRKIPTRHGPIVLENRVTSELMDILTRSFLADNVDKGKSRLAGRLDRKIFDEKITLVDDGLYVGGLATSPADGEGIPSQKTVLVENGRLKGFLYDTYRARKNGRDSTGNASRVGGVKQPPEIDTTNFMMLPGEKSLEELLQDMGDGLLVTSILGAHTANPISGDFSFGVAGQWIENGRPVHPVKGMALAGNLFDMFENNLVVGADMELFHSTGAPSLLIGELTLSGL